MQSRTSVARLMAAGLGSGFVPRAPGTAGSLLALLLGIPLLLAPPWVLPLAALVAMIGGLWAIRAAGVVGDPGWVVIDEVAGQWIALLGLARPNWTGSIWVGLLAAFALFRVLDIAKPGPIGWADRQKGAMGGAFGVMADDVIAGALAALMIVALRLLFPALLG